MAQKIPRLVVKIIGSKQVKQFIEEGSPPGEAAEKQDVTASRSRTRLQSREESALWALIHQAPDRRCVTAPSGDRSRSYIHLKPEPRAAETSEQTGAPEDGEKAELSSEVRAQLSGWQLCSLRAAEDEVAALDVRTLHRSEITQLFLEHSVPLKLPTFSLLLHAFSDGNDPLQIHHRDLLQFIRSSAFPEERHDDRELQCG